jgi:transcriptional regulator with XRE-family HTH domain
MSQATPDTPAFVSSINYEELGNRLRAYRIGASLLAEDVAEKLGVSRAVIYRMEQGKIVKIETVERLAQLLGTSMASLLGVEVEYYSTALGFLERMRQIEESAERIVAHFEPISLLLASDEYLDHLRLMLLESLPQNATDDHGGNSLTAEVDTILDILQDRKNSFAKRRPNIVSLIGLRELERFLRTGLVGSLAISGAARRQRVEAARQEVLRIAELMDDEPMYVQVGLIDDAMPATSFQLFFAAGSSLLAVSPFRFGELPNVRNGIAMVTASPEPVKMYDEMIDRLWKAAHKGKAGAAQLRRLLDRTRT